MTPNPDTFCIAPFKHAHVSNDGKLKVCCQSRDKKEYNYDQLEEWYNSKACQTLRKNLIAGIKDPICNACWITEKNKEKSQRQIYNLHIGGILEKNFNKSFERDKNLNRIINNQDSKNINTFDFKLGNHCNLKCTMCDPAQSSEILLEAKTNKNIAKFYKMPDSKDFVWAKQKKFSEWCTNNFDGIKYIKFTGGEPFINPYLLNTLKDIPEDQKIKCILHFTTNLTILNKEILEQFKKFKETWLDVSIEGTKNVFEYIRKGHSWDEITKNINIILNLQYNNVHIHVSYVVQNLSLFDIENLIQYCDSKKLKLNPLFLQWPIEFKLQTIKTKYKDDLLEKLKEYQGYNKDFVISVCEHIKNNIDYDQTLASKALERLKIFDKARGTNFKNIILEDYFI